LSQTSFIVFKFPNRLQPVDTNEVAYGKIIQPVSMVTPGAALVLTNDTGLQQNSSYQKYQFLLEH
jgi:hypothetical protein